MQCGAFYQCLEIIARRKGVPEDSVPDVVQEAAIAYWQARGFTYWDDPQPQPALLYTLLTRNIANFWRGYYRQKEIADLICVGNETVREEDIERKALARLEASDVMKVLDAESFSIVNMRLLQGFKWREIAQCLKIPISTAHQRFQNALETIRQAAGTLDEKTEGSNDITNGNLHFAKKEDIVNDAPSMPGKYRFDVADGKLTCPPQYSKKHRRGGGASVFGLSMKHRVGRCGCGEGTTSSHLPVVGNVRLQPTATPNCPTNCSTESLVWIYCLNMGYKCADNQQTYEGHTWCHRFTMYYCPGTTYYNCDGDTWHQCSQSDFRDPANYHKCCSSAGAALPAGCTPPVPPGARYCNHPLQ